MDLMDTPHLAWHLSGGTTELLLVTPNGKNVDCRIIGGTTDISAGQLIDRTGQMLSLPFPAGKSLDKLSETSQNRDFFRVKCSNMHFSLSGVQNKVQQFYGKGSAPEDTADYALHSVIFAVSKATQQAMEAYPGLPVVFSGGVASNSLLRTEMAKFDPIFAEPRYSTDNALGVAVLTYRHLEE
jgi:N6-L-threonylcarbamoyladenine synthase